MDNPLEYPAEVWRLFCQLPRVGRFDPATHGLRAAEAGTRANHFRLRLECRVEDDRIVESRFQAFGCPYSIAVGAWLARWCEGRAAADLGPPPIAELRAALEIPEDRAHCWLMAQDVLRALQVM